MRVAAIVLFATSTIAETTPPTREKLDWVSWPDGMINRNTDSGSDFVCDVEGDVKFSSSGSIQRCDTSTSPVTCQTIQISNCGALAHQHASLYDCQMWCDADPACTFVEWHEDSNNDGLGKCSKEKCTPGGDSCSGDACCNDWQDSDQPWIAYSKPPAEGGARAALALAVAKLQTPEFKLKAAARQARIAERKAKGLGYGWGSCVGRCGGHSGGGCWCDSICTWYNDCCTSHGHTYCANCVFSSPFLLHSWLGGINNEQWCYSRGYSATVTTNPPTTLSPTESPTTKPPTASPTEQPTVSPTKAPVTNPPTWNLAVQVGIDTAVDHTENAHTINFPQNFARNPNSVADNTPVIIAGIPTFHGSHFFTVRVRDVSLTGFTLFGQESHCKQEGGVGGHPYQETVPWMAVAPGRHTMPDGTVLEAGRLTLENGHVEEITFKNNDGVATPIQNAVILATIQTKNGPEAVFLRVTEHMTNSQGTIGFKIRMQEDEGYSLGSNGAHGVHSQGQGNAANSMTHHVPETVGWVAVQAGTGSFAGQAYQAFNGKMPHIATQCTGTSCTVKWFYLTAPTPECPDTWYGKLEFEDKCRRDVDNNGVLDQEAPGCCQEHTRTNSDCSFGSFGFSGNNGAVLRTHDGKYTIQEDVCHDEETSHIPEDVSLLIMPGCGPTVGHHNGLVQVSGDPFVVDASGAKTQFFLPLHQEMHLLTCTPGFSLYGRAFDSGIEGDHQQWFDKFRVAVDGRDQLVVQIAKNATSLTDEPDVSPASSLKDQMLSTLHIEVEGHRMDKTGAVGTEAAALVAVWRTDSSETVQISHNQIVLQLKSSVAQKFADKHKQLLYTHLDLRFVELRAEECSSGVLAEIWGVAPMSQETATMLQPPTV